MMVSSLGFLSTSEIPDLELKKLEVATQKSQRKGEKKKKKQTNKKTAPTKACSL